jgi:hypothetical protein
MVAACTFTAAKHVLVLVVQRRCALLTVRPVDLYHCSPDLQLQAQVAVCLWAAVLRAVLLAATCACWSVLVRAVVLAAVYLCSLAAVAT